MTDPSALPNQGVKTFVNIVDMQPYSGVGTMAIWVATALDNGLWGQIGVYSDTSGPNTGFVEIWDLNTYQVLSFGPSGGWPVSPGLHEFAMYWSGQGTVWNFECDGLLKFTWDFGTTNSHPTHPVQTLSEEGYLASPVPFPSMNVPLATEVYRNGAWSQVSYAEAYDNQGWGVEGVYQDAALVPNQISVGSSYAQLNGGTSLWSGTNPNPPTLGASGGGGGGTPQSTTFAATFAETGIPSGLLSSLFYQVTVDGTSHSLRAGSSITFTLDATVSHSYSFQSRVTTGGKPRNRKNFCCSNPSGSIPAGSGDTTITGAYVSC